MSANHDKVRKLLRLADPTRNPSDGESANAFRKAAALMRKLGVSFDDLFRVEVEVERVITIPVPTRRVSDFSDREMVEHLECCMGLSTWEAKFSGSILDQVNRGRRLSEKQRAIVVKILRAKGVS